MGVGLYALGKMLGLVLYHFIRKDLQICPGRLHQPNDKVLLLLGEVS